ncbi:MAG: response regulator [Planctomycetota bacterium]
MTNSLPPDAIRVLIVDDDEDDFVLTRDRLLEVRRPRYEVEWAPSYQHGLDRISRNSIDVCLVDYRLGMHDGLDLVRAAIAAGFAGPLIVFTGQGDHEVDAGALAAGAADYLVKHRVDVALLDRAIRYSLDRKRAEAMARRSEQFLRSAIDSLTAAIVILDEQGRILTANNAWHRISEAVGQALPADVGTDYLGACERLAADGNDNARQFDAAVRRRLAEPGDPIEIEFRASMPALADRWYHVAVTRFDDHSGKPRIVVATTDITDRKGFEEQLRHAQKLEAVGELTSGIAHNFNNLLMGVAGCAQIAARKLNADHPAVPCLDEIRSAVDRGVSLTRQLMAFTHRRPTQAVPLNLGNVIGEMREILQHAISRRIRLAVHTGDAGLDVLADRGHIEQILMNLVVNAREAMPDGGYITIETLARHDADPPSVELRVIDTGVGMDESVRRRIFEPFFSTRSKAESTGLGLSTVYGIVTSLGGSIDVESEPGAGSTFRVLLPATRRTGHAAADSAAIGAAPGSPLADPTTPPAGVASAVPGTATVMLVEDDPIVRATLLEELVDSGLRVLAAVDGNDAIQQAERRSDVVDLLVTDIAMPGMDGSELARRLRLLRPDLRVIFISAWPADYLIEQGRITASDCALQKPFETADLIALVRQQLSAPS